MKPSDFAKVFPCMSRFGKTEPESVAQDIMQVLAKTGDEFRPLTWNEFRLGCKSHHADEYWFNLAAPHCVSEEAARSFAQVWEDLIEPDAQAWENLATQEED